MMEEVFELEHKLVTTFPPWCEKTYTREAAASWLPVPYDTRVSACLSHPTYLEWCHRPSPDQFHTQDSYLISARLQSSSRVPFSPPPSPRAHEDSITLVFAFCLTVLVISQRHEKSIFLDTLRPTVACTKSLQCWQIHRGHLARIVLSLGSR